MPEKILTPQGVKNLLNLKGEVRGVTLKTDAEYVSKERGEAGIVKIEEALAGLGLLLKYKEIETMNFYPVGYRVISLAAIKEVLGFSDEELERMGLYATKISLIVKLFVKYFVSAQRVFFKEAPLIWEKHWNIGRLEPVELNEKEKFGLLRLWGIDLHPIYCQYMKGYFAGILQLMIKTKQIKASETKCVFKGQECHEYLIKWT